MHAASVYPEPGSNSLSQLKRLERLILALCYLSSFRYPVVKVRDKAR